MSYKRLIPCIFIYKGKAIKWFDDKEVVSDDVIGLAKQYCDKGADELIVFDLSNTDDEHDEAIDLMKKVNRAISIPMVAGGNVRRQEDVKKILYTGAKRAILNFSKPLSFELIEEVSKRFGKERIAVSLNDFDALFKQQHLIDKFSSEIIFMHRLDLLSVMNITEIPCVVLDGLLPVIVQDYKTKEVLMMAYMNEEAFDHTLKSGKMTYYSRSRQCRWVKGETSGHYQYVKALSIDCDNDTLLAQVEQIGAACHTGNHTCFYRPIVGNECDSKNPLQVFESVYATIEDRKQHPKEGSYTNYLFDKGIDKILKKVGEEATEIVIAAKNPNPEEIKYEISDFLYHAMVLMVERGVTWEDIVKELADR